MPAKATVQIPEEKLLALLVALKDVQRVLEAGRMTFESSKAEGRPHGR